MKTLNVLLASTAVCGLTLYGSAQAQQSQQQFPQQMQNMMQQMQRAQGQQQQQGQQQGQQQDISQREVRSFFQQVQQTINQAVQNNNPSAIRQWTQNALADNAKIMTMVEVYGENGAREFRTTSLEKQDILRRQQAMMSVAPELLSLIQEYNLNVRIQNVETLAPGVALVTTRVTESGVIGGRGGAQMMSGFGQQSSVEDQSAQQGAGGGQQGIGSRWSQVQQRQQQQSRQGQQSGQLSFNGNADCTHLVQRNESSGNIQIGMTTCTGEMSF